ncbi:MAG: polymerase, sigma 54 subunit, RpoN/SigL [Bacteroidetes bacterium]|jgi:RNA polymerase sigma-54 factor|nr:polymerase, sigma 54 subunit, RpoN/SigL [Bacteroidota bacterium]
MLKQQLAQKQQLKLLPQQLMLVKLLEATTIELDERVIQELESNPALEESSGDESSSDMDNQDEFGSDSDNGDADLGDYRNEDEIPDYKLIANNRSRDEKKEDIPFSADLTFHEFLQEQVGLRAMTEYERTLVEYIIGNIDNDGYLRRSTDDMSNDLLFQLGQDVSEKDLSEAIASVQEFDPPGVCARSLQECLLLQLGRHETESKACKLAKIVIGRYFEEFARKNYQKIMSELGITDEAMKQVVHKVLHLNPKPGNAWSTLLEKNKEVVIPDFIVENDNGVLIVTLNDRNQHSLRVNPDYQQMQQQFASEKSANKNVKEAVQYVKQQIESAEIFIETLNRRNVTLLTTMRAIIGLQQPFFLDGNEALLKPMILKDVAEITGYDLSTISRVSNSKYVQTEFGTFPLKYFFSQLVQTESGEEFSVHEVKNMLQNIIDGEDKKRPYSDEKLAELLTKEGFDIARRTVAKYRDQLGLPTAQLRKQL